MTEDRFSRCCAEIDRIRQVGRAVRVRGSKHDTPPAAPAGGSSGLTVRRVHASGAGLGLALRGELDVFGGVDALRAIRHALRGRPARVTLDLSEVSFMDLSGVRALIRARRLAARSDAEMVLRNVSPSCERLLRVTALHQVFEVEERDGRHRRARELNDGP